MSLIMLSKHEPYPFLLDKYVASYKVLVATPDDSLARDNEIANNLYIELRVPKSEYKNEQVQEIVRWSRLPAREPHYYRDIAIHLIIMGGFERSIVFSHGRIRYETEADTEADFVTVKLLVRQKEDMYEGVIFGTELEAAYVKAKENLENPPNVNIFVPVAAAEMLSEEPSVGYSKEPILLASVSDSGLNMSGEAVALKTLGSGIFGGISSEKDSYYGGDQGWFIELWQKNGGCGPTAASNILAYLAQQNPDVYGNLYSQSDITKESFTNHMNQVIEYIVPMHLPSIGDLKSGFTLGY